MHLQSILSTLLTLTITLPAVSAIGIKEWNNQLSLYDIGPVGTARGYPLETLPNAYDISCSSLDDGQYACGSFEKDGVDALRAIYRCQVNVMDLVEVCHEGERKNRCARNRRGDSREWRRFYPFVSGDKGVCVMQSQL